MEASLLGQAYWRSGLWAHLSFVWCNGQVAQALLECIWCEHVTTHTVNEIAALK